MKLAPRPTLRVALLALWSLLGCGQQRAEHGEPGAGEFARSLDVGAQCDEPAEGCACDGDQPPIPCRPDHDLSQLNAHGERVCFEGTRYCRDGAFSGCEDVRAFALPGSGAGSGSSALVDQVSQHPECSDCEPNCHVVTDAFNPDDGPLDGGFVDGVVFHGSGAGITLEAHDGGMQPEMLDGGVPDGTLFVPVDEGLTGSATGQTSHYASAADVYLLLDRSSSMITETQWLFDRAQTGAGFLPATLGCADGDPTPLTQGMTGALACMIDDVRVGAGMFRDLPFAPYSEDQSLSEPARSADAKREIAYRHAFDFTGSMSGASGQLASVGTLESSGNPDLAGSQIPALYSVATGAGMYAGLYRTAVPDAASCASGDGYPCFRTGTDRIVVVASDSPMHNGPANLPYAYDPTSLTMSLGTSPSVAVPDGNDDWPSAFVLSTDAASELRQFTGSSASLGAQVAASTVGCSANDSAPDALFRFDVTAPGGGTNTVPILVSAEGTGFASTLAVFQNAPSAQVPETLADSDNTNELFSSAYALDDVRGRWVTINGDTTPMGADYQGSLYGAACGTSSFAGDATYSFHVDSATAPTPIEVTVDMGFDHPVVAIYDAAGSLPTWPRVSGPHPVSGNSDVAHAATIPFGGTPYVTMTGNTEGLGADYDSASVGGGVCDPDTESEDAAFKIHVSGRRRLRFDTDASQFDTVLSLHNQPPIPRTAPVTHHTAAATHNNGNEDAATAFATGPLNGQSHVFEGDTSAMTADVDDTFGCGLDDTCKDAVYRISLTTPTSLRLEVSGTGYQPGIVLTRADPGGVTGRYGSAAVGGKHSCGLSGGEVYCWGADDVGQLGNGGSGGEPDSPAAVKATGLTGVAQICAGADHGCAVLRNGSVACWGAGGSGRLGTGGTADAFTPALLSEFGPAAALGPAVQVACGDAFSCALLADGRVACFGDNGHGQLGDGTNTDHAAAELVTSVERFEQLDAGSRHVCAVRTSDDAVFCWGEGSFGKLGDGSTSDNLVPARAGTLTGVRSIAAGAEHSCAALSSGKVQCWGNNQSGQLGIGSSDAGDHANPGPVADAAGTGSLINARAVSAGRAHSCALTLEGMVHCWGEDGANQLGNGSGGGTTLPGKVAVLDDVVQLFGGYDHGCALRSDGVLSCFGDDVHAQLGGGNSAPQAAPVVAQAGPTTPLAFGTGMLDAGVAHACGAVNEPPEAGCQTRWNGSRAYAFCNDQPRTWAGAAQSCEAVGMTLANIDAFGENTYLAGHIDGGEYDWIGVKRESSSDWLSLTAGHEFENLNGERIWHTRSTTRCTHTEFGVCVMYEDSIRGYFISPAAFDLVSSESSWSTSSTWSPRAMPSTMPGYNCAMLNSSRKWQTDDCSGGAGYDGRGGRYATPQFSGGVEHPYLCEQGARFRDVALDAGDYFVTVKGANDGVVGNSCAGAYELKLTDLGAGGGFVACDDNGVALTTDSAIEATLNDGDYYLIVKGKAASDAGSYRLTVRDLDAVTTDEIACDVGTGSSDPAMVSFMAEPGHDYYALVKGNAPTDEAPYTLTVRDTNSGAARLACDDSSSANGNPELTLDLQSGTYYAVLKGSAPGAAGDYELTVGGASPASGTFSPPSYDATVAALQASGIRVASVLSCAGRSDCADAEAQGQQLATDTNGVMRSAATDEDLPVEIVRAVEQLEAADRVTGSIVFAPDANPGFTPTGVVALADAGNRCASTPSGPSFSDCLPGATPSFVVSLHNPALAPVPFSGAPDGAYRFTLHVESTRGGVVVGSHDLPVVVLPTGAPPPDTYTSGSYHQDIEATGCDINAMRILDPDLPDDVIANQRPSWDVLTFKADVRPDTKVDFFVCTAKTAEDLAACNGGMGTASGRRRALTVTADTGTGTTCTVAAQSTDCPDGYCSPYTKVCNHLEGADCVVDEDCPGEAIGRCRIGPSSGTLGHTCEVLNLQADPASALDGANFQPFMRVEADLTALGDGSRTPSLFKWQAWYRCRMVE